jgi:hypothetical protein
MTDARYDGIQWSDAQEAVGSNCLSNFDAAFYQNAKVKPKWVADTNEILCAGMIKAMLDAHRMVWCAQLRYDIRTGAPVEFPSFGEMVSATPNPVGAQETRAKARQFCAGDPAIAAVPALYDVLVFEVQQAIRSSRPIQEPKPAVGLSGVELGAVPVALIALGVAALAGATYLGSTASIEFSKAWSAIEIEKAWAVQRAWAEVQIASQKIAAGQTVELSDWSKMRSAVAAASGSNAGPLIIAGALAVVVAGTRPPRATRTPFAASCRDAAGTLAATRTAKPRTRTRRRSASGTRRRSARGTRRRSASGTRRRSARGTRRRSASGTPAP